VLKAFPGIFELVVCTLILLAALTGRQVGAAGWIGFYMAVEKRQAHMLDHSIKGFCILWQRTQLVPDEAQYCAGHLQIPIDSYARSRCVHAVA
jgi:hypothetical protein